MDDRRETKDKARGIKRISARVWPSMLDDGLYIGEAELCQKLQLRRLSSPFLCLLFSWLDKNTADYKTDAQYTQNYLNNRREFFKKIAGKADGKNSFAQIRYGFSNKFTPGFINKYHHFKNIIRSNKCQEEKKSVRIVDLARKKQFRYI